MKRKYPPKKIVVPLIQKKIDDPEKRNDLIERNKLSSINIIPFIHERCLRYFLHEPDYIECPLVDGKGNFSGFEVEIFVYNNKKEVVFYGTGQGKNISEAKINAAFGIAIELIEEIEKMDLMIKNQNELVNNKINELWKLINENGQTTMNPTTELNAIITKIYKKTPLVTHKMTNKTYICQIKLPDPENQLLSNGEARSKKDAQMRASENMILNLEPFLKQFLQRKNKNEKSSDSQFKKVMMNQQQDKEQSIAKKRKHEELLNNIDVKLEIKSETNIEKRFENTLEIDMEKEKNIVSFVNVLVSQKYKETLQCNFLELDNRDYECKVSFNLEGKIISGIGIARKKSDAKKIACEKLLEHLPIHHTTNLVLPKDRDRNYKFILDNHFKYLHSEHQEEIKKRFLCPNLAEKLYLRSWHKKEISFTKNLDPCLPGLRDGLDNVVIQGFQTTGRKGIFIPAFTPSNQIVGAQIKPNKLKTTEKYVFLSSKAFGGYPIYLPNNELPLYCWIDPKIFEIEIPKEKHYEKLKEIIAPKGIENLSSRNVLGLCEGSLKPLVAAYRLQIPFIGSAGMNFIQSAETLFEYLKEINPKNIIIFPDAGCVANKYILVSYFQTIVLLYKGGDKYNLKIAWYEQHNKIRDNDIDEIEPEDIKNFKLISPIEFFDKIWTDCKDYVETRVRNIDCIKNVYSTEKTISNHTIIEISDDE